MKILVSGGSGFIGSHIVDALIQKGHKVVIIDNLSTGNSDNLNGKAIFYELDIRDKDVKGILKKEKPDIVFHLAAQVSVLKSTEEPVLDTEINVCGSLNLVNAYLESEGSKEKKIIFASTGGAMYGETDIIPTGENVEPFPLAPYGISKLSFEKYLHYFGQFKNLKFVCLRYGNVYGPRQNPFSEAGVISIFAIKLLRGEECVIFGDGAQTRDFVYINDIVRANLLAMNYAGSGIFNVGTGTETSVNQIFSYIRKSVGSKTEPMYARAREGELDRSCLDVKKIKKILGWEARIPIREGIRETVEWFKNRYTEKVEEET